MFIISIDKIVDITATELLYINDRGETDRIILADCARNYALHCGCGLSHCVGERFFSPEKGIAFYEFYDIGHTQLCLVISHPKVKRFFSRLNLNVYTKDFSKFHSVQKKLNHYGWTTIDMT